MKKRISIFLVVLFLAVVLAGCDWCFWSFGSPSRQCIMQGVEATATYGAEQMHIQLTAMP